MLLPGLSSLPLIDRDEPRFARATVEMVERGDWVIPWFNGEYRFDKPPLTYWWMRIHYALFGIHEFSARLHSVLATILTAWILYGFGRRLYHSARAGLLAGVGFTTCFQVLIHGRLAVADMPMVLAVAATMWALWELLFAGNPPPRFGRWFWLLWISAAFGFLAKGPIAWFVPLLALLLHRWAFRRKPLPWRRLQPLPGMLVMLAPIAAWGIPALLRTEGQFWNEGIGIHVVDRGFQSFNDRWIIPGYYLLTMFPSLFPWIGLGGALPVAIRRNWDDRTAFLLAWFVAPFLIFTPYATQLPHYTLPGFGAFFLLLSGNWKQVAEHPWTRRWRTAFCLLTFAGALGLGFGAILLLTSEVTGSGPVAAASLLLSALGTLALSVERGHRTGCAASVATAVLALGWLSHSLREAAVLAPHADVFRATTPNGATVPGTAVGWGFGEPGLVFYGERTWRMVSDEVIPLPDLLADEAVDTVVARRTEYQLDDSIQFALDGDWPIPRSVDSAEAVDAAATIPGWETTRITGLNFARTSWVELIVFRRTE